MPEHVSLFRLYVLRALYLFIAVGLGRYLWPTVLDPARHWELLQGQASCMLASFSLLCVVGLRFPLQMLPVLLWEVIWKTLWLMLVPLPQWMAGHIPWRYVFSHYVKASGDRWKHLNAP
jgi:hypothetical protein